MKAELTAEGIMLVAQAAHEDKQLADLFAKGHLHLVCKHLRSPEKKWGYKVKRARLLLTPSLAEWKMIPFGKRHDGKDARRKQ